MGVDVRASAEALEVGQPTALFPVLREAPWVDQ